MKLEARVVVIERRCSFHGQRGRVTQTTPHLMVLLDGEEKPLRFGESEVVEESQKQHVAGAE